MSTEWIPFDRRLPEARDANRAGKIEVIEHDGRVREALWDWIPPHVKTAPDLWKTNGFFGWRRLP